MQKIREKRPFFAYLSFTSPFSSRMIEIDSESLHSMSGAFQCSMDVQYWEN